MDEKIMFSLIFIFGVFISSISQIILKKSSQIKYNSRIKEYMNPRVILAYIIFFGATLCSVLAYTKIPLSFGPILESVGYIFVAVLSRLFLRERITKQKMLGLSVIIVGIIIYSF